MVLADIFQYRLRFLFQRLNQPMVYTRINQTRILYNVLADGSFIQIVVLSLSLWSQHIDVNGWAKLLRGLQSLAELQPVIVVLGL